MDVDFSAMTATQWILPILCAVMVGMSKAGIPGLGTVAVPLMAMVFPPTQSTGILLPILIAGDIFGISYFHRHADWKVLWRMLPAALLGIIIGFFLMKLLLRFDSDQANDIIRIGIALLVLFLLLLSSLKDKLHLGELQKLPRGKGLVLAGVFGILAGITTQLANAAGPISLIYFLAMRLPKDTLIGTSAWYFFILNWYKVPFMVQLGSITSASLIFNLKLVPAVLLGAILGIFISSKMSRKVFERSVTVLTVISALKLLFS